VAWRRAAAPLLLFGPAYGQPRSATQDGQEPDMQGPLKGPLDIHMGDIVHLRKPHPCGSYEWVVVRVGADIGIRCVACGRRLLLERSALRRRLKRLRSAGEIEHASP